MLGPISTGAEGSKRSDYEKPLVKKMRYFLRRGRSISAERGKGGNTERRTHIRVKKKENRDAGMANLLFLLSSTSAKVPH